MEMVFGRMRKIQGGERKDGRQGFKFLGSLPEGAWTDDQGEKKLDL